MPNVVMVEGYAPFKAEADVPAEERAKFAQQKAKLTELVPGFESFARGHAVIDQFDIALWALATYVGDGWKDAATHAEPLIARAKEMAKKQPKQWSAQAVANAAWAAVLHEAQPLPTGLGGGGIAL